jgi:hypothetical protein
VYATINVAANYVRIKRLLNSALVEPLFSRVRVSYCRSSSLKHWLTFRQGNVASQKLLLIQLRMYRQSGQFRCYLPDMCRSALRLAVQNATAQNGHTTAEFVPGRQSMYVGSAAPRRWWPATYTTLHYIGRHNRHRNLADGIHFSHIYIYIYIA